MIALVPARRANNVNDVDRAISRAISALPPTPLDTAMKALSGAANHSLLWFALAAAAGRCARAPPARRRCGACSSIAADQPAGERRAQAAAAATAPGRVRAARLPDDRQPADVVVVPVRALGVRGGVRDRGGDGEPPHRARRGPVGRRGGLLAGARRRALDVGRRGGGGRRHRGGAGDRALVAGARAGRGAGPAAGHRARAARRQGPGDRVQPALRRPGPRPGRRAGGGAAAGGRACAPIRTATSTTSSTRPSSTPGTRCSPSAWRAATARWRRRPPWPGGAGCRWSWCRRARSTTSPATSACTTCRRRWTPPARGRRWPWTSRSSTCTPAAAPTPSRPR